jgi:DNA polymerase-3 subunit delta'
MTSTGGNVAGQNAATVTDALPAYTSYNRLGTGYALLWRHMDEKRRNHAYLLAGPKGVGKYTFARLLAAKLQCEGLPKPCGQCDACVRVLGGNEPDVIEILGLDDKAIPIERIREAISQISQHSFGSGPRVVIVEPVERLTPAAQNCLLKSLEEPQADVVFLLLTHEPSAVLGTIASRCAMVKLTPWPDDELKDALLAMGFDAGRVQKVLPRAGGVIGEALATLHDETGESETAALAEAALAAASDAETVALSTRLKDDRGGAEKVLAAIEQSLHTALLAKAGILPAQALMGTASWEFAQYATEQQLAALLQAVFETRRRRQSQVNWQASIDRLLTTIVEAKTKWRQS